MGAITENSHLTEEEKNVLRVMRRELQDITQPLGDEIKAVRYLLERQEKRRQKGKRHLLGFIKAWFDFED